MGGRAREARVPVKVVTPAGDELVQRDARDATPGRGEVLLLACVRDEAVRLPHFVDYYRSLGVDRFLVVDNDSGDGTADVLLGQPDVHVFHTAASYAAARYGVDWVNALARRFAPGHWIVVADADELLVYPGCEERALGELTRRLDDGGHTALLTFLIDMYADGPIRNTVYEPGTPFLATCPYLDSDSYHYRRYPLWRASWRMVGVPGWWRLSAHVPMYGGARRRLFWREGSRHPVGPPYLPKVPLVRWAEGLAFSHSTHTIRGVRLAPVTGALLHFKLFADFAEHAAAEAAREEHWAGAAQYAIYAEALAAEPALSAMYAGSVALTSSQQLVELGLVLPG